MKKAINTAENPFFKINDKGKDIKEKAVVGLTQIAVILIIAILFIILGIIIYQGREKFSWEFISSFPTDGMTKGGIFPALIGTFILVVVMSIAAVPFGTITAIYLKEYAKEKGQSLSELVENYFKFVAVKHPEIKEKQLSPKVRKLRGIIKVDDNFDYRKILTEGLSKKYEV